MIWGKFCHNNNNIVCEEQPAVVTQWKTCFYGWIHVVSLPHSRVLHAVFNMKREVTHILHRPENRLQHNLNFISSSTHTLWVYILWYFTAAAAAPYTMLNAPIYVTQPLKPRIEFTFRKIFQYIHTQPSFHIAKVAVLLQAHMYTILLKRAWESVCAHTQDKHLHA